MSRKLQQDHKLEFALLGLFIILYCIISAFHEPWFDEAQAWQIAKCASLKEILFEIPHYEGHPPIWHLILAIPAKLGIPFEIGLKSIGLIISTIAAYLMLFYSKLPRKVRLFIPFTYFFFYQYGIIVRPYGLMLIFLLLLGMNLVQRREHPWIIVGLLCGLCLTSAYGILFSGGIAICILWEVYREKGITRLIKELVQDPRTSSLLLLLFSAILLGLQIFPKKDTYATNIQGNTSLALRLFCAFFTFPVDCFLSTSPWFSVEQVSMQVMNIPISELIICSILGILLWLLIISVSSKETLKFFAVPYALYVFFAAAIYFSTHHIGLIFLLTLFWGEFTCRSHDQFETGKILLDSISTTKKDRLLAKYALMIIGTACMIIPLYWSISASVHELKTDYCYARRMATFIKNNKLENSLIICNWNDDGSAFPSSEGHEDYINTFLVSNAVPINAYFNHNIVSNLNLGNDKEAYTHHKTVSYEESQSTVKIWRSNGFPEIVIGYPSLSLVFGDKLSPSYYTCIYKEKTGFIWKNVENIGVATIYMRNDLLNKYVVAPIDDKEIRYIEEGIMITDEMKEQYKNGVPIEEIIKPYLDLMFGEEQ